MWVQQNPNPLGQHVGDCVVRALSIVLDQSWVKTYLEVCIQGLLLANMPSCNNVWGAYLRSKGFKRAAIPDTCPDCYSVRDFCKDNPSGVFVLGTGNSDPEYVWAEMTYRSGLLLADIRTTWSEILKKRINAI